MQRVVIEKLGKKDTSEEQPCYQVKDRWTGAMYGKRVLFDQYVHEAGTKMGKQKAKQAVFIADGAKHNWDIQINNFHDAIPILDVYHALEHLADFCSLFKNPQKGKQHFGCWRKMMLAGDTPRCQGSCRVLEGQGSGGTPPLRDGLGAMESTECGVTTTAKVSRNQW